MAEPESIRLLRAAARAAQEEREIAGMVTSIIMVYECVDVEEGDSMHAFDVLGEGSIFTQLGLLEAGASHVRGLLEDDD